MRLLLKSSLFTLSFLFIFINIFGQTTFDAGERLANIRIKGVSIEPPVAPLQETGTIIKEEARVLFLKKAQEAIRIIKSNNYKKQQHRFYLQLWNGDSVSLINYLKNVETALQSGNIANFAGFGSVAFNSIFNKHLSDTATVFRWLPLDTLEGVLIKKDVFKNFITDYYNEILPSITSEYVNKEDIIEASYYLLEQTDNINKLMNVYRDSLQNFSKTLYNSLRDYHANLTLASSPYKQSMTLLRNDWFKQWFWLTGGEIRINPIDFGIDTIISQQVLDLSEINISKQNLDDIFLEQRLDLLDNYFMASKPNIATVEKWVNKVNLPIDKLYFQFSAIDKIKFANNEKELKRNITVDKTKTLVIHNISSDRKAGLREDRKPIPNISAFQEDLNQVISNLGELAIAYRLVKETSWLMVSNFLAPLVKYDKSIISPRPVNENKGIENNLTDIINITVDSYDTFTVSGSKSDDFLLVIQTILKKDNLLVIPIFQNVFGTNDKTFSDVAYTPYKGEFEIQLASYLALIIQDAANQILKDSFMVAGMIHIYNKASSPLLQPIKFFQDKLPRYYSYTLHTTPIDSTVESTVQPYTVLSKTSTDSIFIGKFSYKIGRTKRFTLSAGLAYTLNSYDQSVAKAENGTVSITNSSQQFRFVVGLNFYLGKRGLYSLNNGLGKLCERWYGFFGVGIPKSIENLYIGLGRDLWPGLKVTAGAHIAKHNKYLIQNNQIVEERLRYRPAGPFISLAIDPTSVVNLLNVFKK